VKYDGKFASRWRAKSPDALCAVLPYIKGIPADTKKQHVLCTHAVGSGASDENRTRNLSLGS
jgi:hypothetical protein